MTSEIIPDGEPYTMQELLDAANEAQETFSIDGLEDH